MPPNKSTDHGLVFSTEQGRICPACKNPSKEGTCRKTASVFPSDGIIRIGLERKGRKGQGVTLVMGLPLDPDELRKKARDLKKKCGCGGSIKNGMVEIQGDHRDMLMADFTEQGYKVKRVGG